MAIIFDGKTFAHKKEAGLVKRVKVLGKKGIIPKLTILLANDTVGSRIYINLKQKLAEKLGIETELMEFSHNHTAMRMLRFIKSMNLMDDIHGTIVQMPIRAKVPEKEAQKIINAISPQKDVDGLTPVSNFLPATTRAVLEILKEAERLTNQHFNQSTIFAVIGSEGFVGKSVAAKLTDLNYEVIAVDKKTQSAKDEIKKADVVISAVGKEGIIKKDMIKNGAIVIDVGSPKADTAFDVREVASFVTPVPGGVGPLTVINLMENVVSACEALNSGKI